MGDQRPRPEADRILVAQLTGEARHRARWRPLTEDEEAAALAEIRTLAGGRADLLAQVAGIFEGTSEGEPDEPLARSAARLCRMAGRGGIPVGNLPTGMAVTVQNNVADNTATAA